MPDQNGISFLIEGKEYQLDDLELGELEWLEEELGANIEEAIKSSPMKAAVRVVCLVKRREDPSFSLDDARKLKLTIFDGDQAAADPPSGAGKPASSRRAKSGATS